MFRAMVQVNKSLAAYNKAMGALQLREGLRIAMAVSGLGNAYFQGAKPWVAQREGHVDRAATIVTYAAEVVLVLIALLDPFMPAFADKVRHCACHGRTGVHVRASQCRVWDLLWSCCRLLIS